MATRPSPDFTRPMQVGFVESDTAPIIHSVRWRHKTSPYKFTDVNDVITYHEDPPLVINITAHKVSYLDVYFLKSAGITEAKAYLRYARATDNVTIEEPYTVGEKGTTIQLANHPTDSTLTMLKGIAFTQADLQDGTPMYNFTAMAEEGIYQVWIKATDSAGNILNVLIPFEWDFAVEEPEPTEPPTEPEEPAQEGEQKAEDEYYVTVVEGQSAFTKKPSTHYRMAVVGMLSKPFCFERGDTPPAEYVSRPAEVPLVNDKPAAKCEFSVSPAKLVGDSGGEVKFQLTHVNTSGLLSLEAMVDENSLEDLGEGSIGILQEGLHNVTFVATYNDGQECIAMAEVEGKFKCGLTVTGTTSVGATDTATLTVGHGANDNGVVTVKVPTGVTQTGDYTFTADATGTYSVEFEATYPNGEVCKKSVNLTFEAEPAPPDPTKPKCGELVEGSSNHAVFTYSKDELPAGEYSIDYDFYSAQDKMLVKAGDTVLHDTGMQADKNGSGFKFNYDPTMGDLVVKINEEGATGTAWEFKLICPTGSGGGGTPIPPTSGVMTGVDFTYDSVDYEGTGKDDPTLNVRGTVTINGKVVLQGALTKEGMRSTAIKADNYILYHNPNDIFDDGSKATFLYEEGEELKIVVEYEEGLKMQPFMTSAVVLRNVFFKDGNIDYDTFSYTTKGKLTTFFANITNEHGDSTEPGDAKVSGIRVNPEDYRMIADGKVESELKYSFTAKPAK